MCDEARPAAAEPTSVPDEDLRNLKLLEITEGGRRCVLVVPRYLPPAAALPLVVLGAGALWLPGARSFQARWHGVRHREPSYPAIADEVAYGPLPRYRAQ